MNDSKAEGNWAREEAIRKEGHKKMVILYWVGLTAVTGIAFLAFLLWAYCIRDKPPSAKQENKGQGAGHEVALEERSKDKESLGSVANKLSHGMPNLGSSCRSSEYSLMNQLYSGARTVSCAHVVKVVSERGICGQKHADVMIEKGGGMGYLEKLEYCYLGVNLHSKFCRQKLESCWPVSRGSTCLHCRISVAVTTRIRKGSYCWDALL
ncbi:hypothetical protein BJ508DRAFT_309470 [Ascobolus immersus RN42]|uniref:Uncharacterized protein n=1 Tax=Ascobolus immersus RN42 TaxID=1160509 RepID=A0A3N4HWP2_ASCIM|nr:hypothetical protein BJ508DRAFT_309470 [Ascobolus immersus RN42]